MNRRRMITRVFGSAVAIGLLGTQAQETKAACESYCYCSRQGWCCKKYRVLGQSGTCVVLDRDCNTRRTGCYCGGSC